MKRTGFWNGFGLGLILSVLVAGLCITASAAAQRSISVEDGIGISLNGASFIPRDAQGKEVPVFLYNGTTYVPVRAVGEAMGLEVGFDSATRTVQLTTSERAAARHSDSGSYISSQRAKEIALTDAGVRAADAVFLRVRLDWDDGRAEYEVEFYSGSVEYDYDIDAVSGAIRSADRELEDFNAPVSAPSTNSGAAISADRAKQIALAEVPAGATVVKCELDRDDGRLVYEVELYSGNVEYSFEIDAKTGSILERDVDDRD